MKRLFSKLISLNSSVDRIQFLQRTIGNQAVQKLIKSGTSPKCEENELKRQLLAHELTHVVQQGGETIHRQPDIKQDKAPAGVDPAFWEWWKRVIGYEGDLDAWLKNPANVHDRGGKTKYGVTISTFKQMAKGVLQVEPTDANFEAMTPNQAMAIGQALWKSSGANRIKNTGVGIVLAEWYWGGINLSRLSKLLKEKGRAATFKNGMPDDATLAFMNTLPPGELIDLMSDAKAAQYRAQAANDATQKKFLAGWLKRNEERRAQAREFVPPAGQAEEVAPNETKKRQSVRPMEKADYIRERLHGMDLTEFPSYAIDPETGRLVGVCMDGTRVFMDGPPSGQDGQV